MRKIALLTTLCAAAWAAAAANLARNPSFESDANGDGAPDEWQWAGDSRLVTQSLTLDKGRDGKRCAKLACTKFTAGNPAAHAMLAQLGIPVKRGTNYRVAFWARAESIACDIVSVALSDTSVWASCGLGGAFAPSAEWQRFEFFFQARRDCPEKSRFQLWFGSTGTLWVDDVEFAEAGSQARRPGHIIPSAGKKNLIPNASFEAGHGNWGSAEWDNVVHWGGRMNHGRGYATPTQKFHGRHSLEIRQSPGAKLFSHFDYYELSRTQILAPLSANKGWIEVEPGKPYTLSVYMKAAAANTPARLAVRQFEGRSFDKAVRASTEWERHSLTFTPTSPWCYVLAGPDLRKTPETPDPPETATLSLDAIQLERGDAPTVFQPRDEVEFAVALAPFPILSENTRQSEFAYAQVANTAAEARKARLELSVTDFFDREVWKETRDLDLEAGRVFRASIQKDHLGNQRGFYRAHARLTVGETVTEETARLAIIPWHEQGRDSRFGINHAYPWGHLVSFAAGAGMRWVRDWSLKWQTVEPEKGRFTFEDADRQLWHAGKAGHVLGLLPFPSANWSSSAPDNVNVTDRYPGNRARVAYAPRDAGEFENYVTNTVGHYRGGRTIPHVPSITWWQCFNEPVFTDYALPRKHGYTAKDYAKWTIVFASAARRARPGCRILAGMGYISEGQIMQDFEEFFAAGGLAACDAVDIHHYPRIRPPEFIEPLLEHLNALMDKHGDRKPLWLTEYGYYAEDEPWIVPLPHHDFDQPLPSERVQAEYAVRWATLCFANGVEKVFYHAGTCGGINSGSLQGVFFEYSGQPRKIYAAQAVMAHLLTTTCRFVKKLSLGEGVRAYLFRDGQRCVCVVWAPKAAPQQPVKLGDDKLVVWDIMGRPQKEREFAPSGTPVYVISDGLTDAAFEAALK